jgi:high affinity Mn2+ porin
MHLFTAGMYNAELELRYKPFDHPGIAKFGGWMHNTYASNFDDVLNLVNAGMDIDSATASAQRLQAMWGYYINLQQEILDDVGFFARCSWNDGQSQYSAFTDISSSLSGSFSIKGKRWGRPNDTVGIAGAIDYASSAFQGYLANDGTGLLIGDVQFPTYGPEHIIEVYYAAQLMKGLVVTADYQHIDNPAYNAVRGPVMVFSGRLRVSF